MKNIKIGNTQIEGSEIILGCMRIDKLSTNEASVLINTALEEGINFFDHADIYGNGKAEEVFALAAENLKLDRQKIIVQSKCGICKGYYDFSKEHILKSVNGTLSRLKTDYLDILLLHRPDTLMVPEEVAEAFAVLNETGKVRYFGVCNQNPMQIELLNKYLASKIIINQLQFSIMHSGIVDSGLNVNMKNFNSIDHDGFVLDYCRLNEITVQAWSPFQYGLFEGVFLDNEKFPDLNRVLNKKAEEKGVSNTAVAAAWILRHPAKIQTIAGTTKAERLKAICRASTIELSRKEWYEIYLAAGNQLP